MLGCEGGRFWGGSISDSRGVMTAETGTYRWMAPEVINHQLYDQKADVFSLRLFCGARDSQGPPARCSREYAPKLVELMQKGWDADPDNRLPFSAIKMELEGLLQEIQVKLKTAGTLCN
ncbi:putative dual-specificity kinase TKL-Pl-4 family [Helianthus annuus]|nr:putative dual-specificity kinase TKL-Pl-4 family [Helianthus annuus]